MTTGAEIDALLETGLPEQWYALLPANWVKDEPVGITRLGKRLVLWRDGDGAVRVHTDRCPHRGARFSQGHVIDGLLTCTYHGMQFDGDGTVVRVPAYPGCQLEGMQGVRTWPAVEKAGCIFAWMGEGEPAPLAFPEEFDDPEWSHFLCTGTWQGSYLYALENVVDPMHGTYLHAKSYTLAYGSGADEMEIERTGDGFTVRRTQQVGMNFDWTEFHSTGADWVRLDLPYPPGAGPGGMFRILGYVTPVDADACQVFFWRLRKVGGLAARPVALHVQEPARGTALACAGAGPGGDRTDGAAGSRVALPARYRRHPSAPPAATPGAGLPEEPGLASARRRIAGCCLPSIARWPGAAIL